MSRKYIFVLFLYYILGRLFKCTFWSVCTFVIILAFTLPNLLKKIISWVLQWLYSSYWYYYVTDISKLFLLTSGAQSELDHQILSRNLLWFQLNSKRSGFEPSPPHTHRPSSFLCHKDTFIDICFIYTALLTSIHSYNPLNFNHEIKRF